MCNFVIRKLICRLPEGQTPKSLQVDLDPSRLRVSNDGQLFHFINTKTTKSKSQHTAQSNASSDNDGDDDIEETGILGLIETATAQRLFDELPISIEIADSKADGVQYSFRIGPASSDAYEIQRVPTPGRVVELS